MVLLFPVRLLLLIVLHVIRLVHLLLFHQVIVHVKMIH